MEATVVDLRYKMKNILKALERHEKVRILYHGKEKGIMIPTSIPNLQSVRSHPFFGLSRKQKKSVKSQMKLLRDGRYHAL